MLIHVSDECHGRIDVIPGSCYVETEFVSAWLLPVLPRRTFLAFEDDTSEVGTSWIRTRLSLKSVALAYFDVFLAGWLALNLLLVLGAVLIIGTVGFSAEGFRKTSLTGWLAIFALLTASFVGSFLLLRLRKWLSVASLTHRQSLSEVRGLPPGVVEILRRKEPAELRFDEHFA